MSIIDVTDANFDSEVTKSSLPVIIDIWATWCVSPDSTIMKDKRKLSVADSI
jgi:thioredoxin-like negative regulator of GroEL